MLSRLQAFLVTAEEGNITKAADKLYLSQPAVSMKIISLEKELGVPLFVRTKKAMILTEQGEAFYQNAQAMINAYKEGLKTINAISNNEVGTLSISSALYFGTYRLPSLLSEYLSLYPNISVNADITFSQFVINDILTNKYELGFIGDMDFSHYPQLNRYLFGSDKLVVIVSNKHPWGQVAKSIKFEELSGETFVFNAEASSIRRVIDQELKNRGIIIKKKIFLGNTEAVIAAVEHDLGISIVPFLSVENRAKYGLLKTIEITDVSLSRNLYYIYRKDRALSVSTSKFLDLVIQRCQTNLSADTEERNSDAIHRKDLMH